MISAVFGSGHKNIKLVFKYFLCLFPTNQTADDSNRISPFIIYSSLIHFSPKFSQNLSKLSFFFIFDEILLIFDFTGVRNHSFDFYHKFMNSLCILSTLILFFTLPWPLIMNFLDTKPIQFSSRLSINNLIRSRLNFLITLHNPQSLIINIFMPSCNFFLFSLQQLL